MEAAGNTLAVLRAHSFLYIMFSSASGFENSKIKDFFFFSHFLRPSLFSNCRSRIESKNTLAHLVKVDDCFELSLHWG